MQVFGRFDKHASVVAHELRQRPSIRLSGLLHPGQGAQKNRPGSAQQIAAPSCVLRWRQRPSIGPSAAVPSPSSARASRPTVQKAGYSQPPSLLVKSQPALPWTITIVPSMSGTSASATQRVSMPRMSRTPPPTSAAIVRYASSPGRPRDLKNCAVPAGVNTLIFTQACARNMTPSAKRRSNAATAACSGLLMENPPSLVEPELSYAGVKRSSIPPLISPAQEHLLA